MEKISLGNIGCSMYTICMLLIKKLGCYGKYKTSRAIFLCPFCYCTTEKYLCNGKYALSCGCASKEIKRLYSTTHGWSKTKLYSVWDNMKYRCFNPSSKDYKRYGQRGITVHKKWLIFSIFKEWAIENGYKEYLTIDRIDNNGNYTPSNCRWVNQAQSSRNTRATILNWEKVKEIRTRYSQGGVSQRALAIEFGVHFGTLNDVILHKTWKVLDGSIS